MQKLLTFLLIINCYSLSAQDDAELAKNTWMIYTSPLQAIDVPAVPKFTLGVEYIHNNTFGYALELGWKNHFKDIMDTYQYQYSSDEVIKEIGYSARFEFKIYDKLYLMKKTPYKDYLGIEYRFIKSNFNYAVDYYEKNDDSTSDEIRESFTDFFGVKKNVNIINIKYGVILNLGKHFYADVYAGFGIRNKDVTNTDRVYDSKIHTKDEGPHDFHTSHHLEESSGNHFNVSLGGKFGYRF